MTTLEYNSAGLSVKDRLTITNLLGLFSGRLNAKWVGLTQAGEKPAHIVLTDVDQPEGLQRWKESKQAPGRVAVTANDRWPDEQFIARPIRAFGPNGVIVLFNSMAQLLSSPSPSRGGGSDQRQPALMRMTARLEAPPRHETPPPSPIRPPAPVELKPAVLRAAAPPPPSRAPQPVAPPAVPAPVAARVAVRWGPPEPVVARRLARMPGARIHRLGDAPPEYHEVLEIQPLPPPPVLEAPPPPQKAWDAWKADSLPQLVEMPIAHRPVEILTPRTPAIAGHEERTETGRTETGRAPIADDEPFLRTSPPQWRAPQPEPVTALTNFRQPQEPPVSTASEAVAEHRLPETALAAEAPIVAEAAIVETTIEPEVVIEAPEVVAPDPIDSVQQNLASLSEALDSGPEAEQLPGAEADWWITSSLEADSGGEQSSQPAEGALLLNALIAIKSSGQPGVVEIAGLPSVCVIPTRNVYFTTAPAARFESSLGAQSEVAWRSCESEAEARRSSGTEQSRQASLDQLWWTASLLAPPADPEGIADRRVRLRRWPPVTESRGRNKFVRYATLLSGAQASPREIAEITGDPVDEVVGFVSACSRMGLLETSGQPKAPAAAPTRTGGAGILRSMLEQLAPPKI